MIDDRVGSDSGSVVNIVKCIQINYTVVITLFTVEDIKVLLFDSLFM